MCLSSLYDLSPAQAESLGLPRSLAPAAAVPPTAGRSHRAAGATFHTGVSMGLLRRLFRRSDADRCRVLTAAERMARHDPARAHAMNVRQALGTTDALVIDDGTHFLVIDRPSHAIPNPDADAAPDVYQPAARSAHEVDPSSP